MVAVGVESCRLLTRPLRWDVVPVFFAVVVTKNIVRPWGIAFLPNGDLLVTERNSLTPGEPGRFA